MVEVKYYGHSFFFVKGKGVRVVFDPFDPSFTGLPYKTLPADIVCISHDHPDHSFIRGIEGSPYVISGPGEYEVRGLKFIGINSFHDDAGGKNRGRNTIYLLNLDGVNLCHLGDLGHRLTDAQLKELESVDILFVPVGGYYTIDAKTAVEVISQVEPKIVIPMHFRQDRMKPSFNVLTNLDDFIKEMGETPKVEKVLKIDNNLNNLEGLSLYTLENSML